VFDVQRILELGRSSTFRIGVGLPLGIISDTKKALAECHSKLEIESFDDPKLLVGALSSGKIDAAVRGTMGAVKVLDELKREFSLSAIYRTAVMADSKGKPFLLTPVGIDEGKDLESKLRLVLSTQSYFSVAGWRLEVAVLSKGRPEDRGRGKDIEMSLADGEKLVQRLRKDGLKAEHRGILLEDAVSKADLIVAPDGITGNLIFRAAHFVGGGRAFGAPVVNMKRVFIDTSRAKVDFTDPILLAAGLVAVKSGIQKKA
jgi:putative methanogen marker protein 4